MDDAGRIHRPGAKPGAVDVADAGEPALAPRSRGLFGPGRMDAVHEERQEAATSLRNRLAVLRKADGGKSAPTPIPEGGGAPLPSAVRGKMEPRLGADLSAVRVHTGGESAQAATALGARAFTVGSDVHFNAGELAPGTKEGDKLLAHELTHVVQGQRSGVQRKADHGDSDGAAGEHEAGGHDVSHPDDPAEKEADAVAEKVAGDIHGNDKGKQKGKGKDKKAEPNDATAEAGATPAGGGGDGGAAAHGAGDAHAGHEAAAAAPEAKSAAGAPAHSPAPISAKYSGVGRKVFRKPKPPSNPGSPGGGASSDGKPMDHVPTVDEWVNFMTTTADKHPEHDLVVPKLNKWGLPGEALFKDVMKALAKAVPAASLPRIRETPDKKTEYEAKLGVIRNAQKPAQEHFNAIAKQLAAAGGFATLKNTACVYSGPFARDKAAAAGGKVLEDTAAGAFDKCKLMAGTAGKNEWNVVEPLWRALSQEYAQAAKGKVRGFFHYMGETFNQVERPILEMRQAQGEGVSIEYYALYGKKEFKGSKFESAEQVDVSAPQNDRAGWRSAMDKAKADGRLTLG